MKITSINYELLPAGLLSVKCYNLILVLSRDWEGGGGGGQRQIRNTNSTMINAKRIARSESKESTAAETLRRTEKVYTLVCSRVRRN